MVRRRSRAVGAVHLRLKSFNIPAFTGAYGLIDDAASREAYLTALKSRDGLSSPSVPALVAHIAAYREGAPWLDALRAYLQDNMRYIAQALNHAFPQLNWQPPRSPISHGSICARSA